MEVIPATPESHVWDEAHVFSSEQAAKLRTLLHKAQKQHMDIYVATFTFLDGEAIESRAERLKRAWCRLDFGLVLVFERGSSNLTFSALTQEAMPLTVGELEAVFERANVSAAAARTPGERLVALVELLVPMLDEKVALQQRLQRQIISPEQWFIFAGLLTALILLILALVVARRIRQAALARRLPPAFFPTVAVAPRFGGTCGGGVMAEVNLAAGSTLGK
ncbi:MAG: TPM domain-containing protein [Verrucomicrobiales bacterium]